MAGRLRTSPAGLQLIKSFEGFRETATQLPAGRWTIGYGHVRTAREGLTISEKDAEDLLVYDLKPAEDAIANMVFAPLLQNQFDALVSLVFNITVAQFRDSDILRHLNSGDQLAAANGFDVWRRARLNGRVIVVDALVRRRAAEKSMFLDHPSGPTAAPSPIVRPEMDVADAATEHARPHANDEDDKLVSPVSWAPGSIPSVDIAEAVRRLAERTREAITPAPEIVAQPHVQPEIKPEREPSVEAATPAPGAAEETAPPVREPGRVKTPDELEQAGRVIAERVRSILKRAEATLESRVELHPTVQTVAAPQETDRPEAQVRHADNENVREGLPDFDAPAERMSAAETARTRRLIDDTETFEPDRKPEDIFAEAERKARLVNGQARRVGPLSGRLIMNAPWIIVLVLSVVGFAIGAVEAFTAPAPDADTPKAASMVLSVFGVMLVMSLYFLFWNRQSRDRT
jgi:GH24 family phage-related lysozyme (muramidase)